MEKAPEHHTSKGFRNPYNIPSASQKGFFFNARRVWDAFVLPDILPGHVLSEQVALANLAASSDKDTITWLGQSTFLIRLDGKTILTDPFLTEIASPFIKGPRRFVPPGISIANLPVIDILLVSHDHYDHLDEETIESLSGKENIQVLAPLGLREFFINSGYKTVKELDWNESFTLGSLEFLSLPAIHDSGRGLYNKNKTLWCSWAITSPHGKYFFSGDTAYSEKLYNHIGVIHDAFDIAIIPIGAYEPRKLMWMSHVNPEEAFYIAQDIKANIIVPQHWGTIRLSDEPIWEPPLRLKKAALDNDFPCENVWIMKIGETRPLPESSEKIKSEPLLVQSTE